MLGRKKSNKQEDWIKAWEQAKEEHDIDRSEKLINLAISRLPDDLDKCVYGWSGGKDTLALEIILNRTGKKIRCCHGTIGKQWEYPSFYEYCQKHKPEHCVDYDFGITDEWLEKHPKLIFPDTHKEEARWYVICNQAAFYGYGKDAEAEHILLGHRSIDGNIINSHKNGKLFPIGDFSHEDVFCILACNGIELPDIYYYPDGFYHGTHAWIMRVGGRKAMEEVWQIDKSLLIAHKNLPKIKEFLATKGIQ